MILATFLAATAVSAAPTSKQVAELMKKGFVGVKDYKVDAVLTIKSEAVNVTGMPMKVYYKHPGKVHIEATEGFAMVPRDMQLGNPAQEMAKNFDVKVLGTGKKAGRDAVEVQLIPKQPGQGRGMLKAWIDTERGLMLSLTGQDSNGPKVKSDWKYEKVQGKYWLPSEIRAELSLPKQQGRNDPTDPDDRPSRRFHRPKMSNGAINIKFTNYKVNTGIPDSMFKKVEG